MTYNLYGNNARVNIHSTDSSINIVNEDSPEVFKQLLAAIRKADIQTEPKTKIESAVQGMQQSYGRPSFGEKYQTFMSILADHIQVFGPIVAPYLPTLTSLIT